MNAFRVCCVAHHLACFFLSLHTMKSLRALLSIFASKFTGFETVSGYVTLITVYNLSCTLLNIYVPLCCRRLNTLDHRAGWSPEAARWLNGSRLGLGPGNAIVLFFFSSGLAKCGEHLCFGSLL